LIAVKLYYAASPHDDRAGCPIRAPALLITSQFRYGYDMTAGKHDLVHEFPQFRDRIHTLKTQDAHFARLFAQYHELDHELHRIEQGIETPSDVYSEDLKKKRARLKDELYSILSATA
jgi:uncharacterized protein YdcH (DUF465 family)